METLKVRLEKLTRTEDYRFQADLVKDILKTYKEKMADEKSFNEAVKIDQKHHAVKIKQSKVLEIIDEYVNLGKFNLKYSPSTIIDGFGNLAVSYSGDPYITLRLLLMSLRTHNNIVFFSKKYYAINTKIVETLNMICQKKNYLNKLGFVEFDSIDKAMASSQNFFNMILYVGEKREYINFKKKAVVPTQYLGYGNVDVFVENKGFKDLLLDIDDYGNSNGIQINYYADTEIDDTLKFMNKYELTDCFVLLSKNTDVIYKFMSEIKAKNIYINANPFIDYKIWITERDLTYKKNIIMN